MADPSTEPPSDMPLDHEGKQRTTPSSPYTPASPTNEKKYGAIPPAVADASADTWRGAPLPLPG